MAYRRKDTDKNYKGRPRLKFITQVMEDAQCGIHQELKKKKTAEKSKEMLPTDMLASNGKSEKERDIDRYRSHSSYVTQTH